MPDLQQAMQTPERIDLPGGPLDFPLLESPEIAELCALIKRERRKEMEESVKKSELLTFLDKVKAVNSIKDPSYWDFAEWVDTPFGADAVLIRSLMKGGKLEDQAKDAIKPLAPFRKVQVAQIVAGTYVRPSTENPT